MIAGCFAGLGSKQLLKKSKFDDGVCLPNNYIYAFAIGLKRFLPAKCAEECWQAGSCSPNALGWCLVRGCSNLEHQFSSGRRLGFPDSFASLPCEGFMPFRCFVMFKPRILCYLAEEGSSHLITKSISDTCVFQGCFESVY